MCGVTLCYIRIYCCYHFGVKPYLSSFLCFSFYNKIISNIYSNTFKTKSDIAIIFVSTIKQNLENSRGKGSLLFLPIFHDVFFLPDISGFRLLSFPFFQGASFSHYFTIGLPVINSLSFPSSENVLISPSLLKDIFSDIGFWVDSSFLPALEKYCGTSFWLH